MNSSGTPTKKSRTQKTSQKVARTIGIDIGDRWSHSCVLNHEGEVVEEGRFRTAEDDGSFRTAWNTWQEIEAMHRINKGRVRWLTKNDVIGQISFFTKLFTIAA